jgi:putative nucleotidyltransferase with HDIG domain
MQENTAGPASGFSTNGDQHARRLQALLDNAPYGAHMWELSDDDSLIFTGYNRRAAEMLGVDHDALLGMTLEEAFPGNIGAETPDAYRKVARDGGTWESSQYTYDSGSVSGVFEVYAFSSEARQVSVFFRDVTELHRAEIRLQESETQLRLTVDRLAAAVTTLKALSACNEALVRAESEQTLLEDICSIAVEKGGYLMTWVGYAEDDADKSVRPVASAGRELGYLSEIHVTWDDAPTGLGVAGTAIRTGKRAVANSVEKDPLFTPWKHEALARGYRSAASFPLRFADGTVMGVVLFYAAEEDRFGEEELSLLAELSSDLAFGIETLRAREARLRIADELGFTNRRLEGVLRQITVALGRAVEARDPYTSGHEERVAVLGRQIALEMGLGEEEADAVEIAGLVHDIGKLRIPAEILTKPSALSAIELRLIREHSRTGYEILRDIAFVWPIADIVLQHHERLDGSGYPDGITGEDMLVPSRILAVADVVEAMASHRPYRAARGLDEAIAEISDHPDLYDPDVAAACIRLYQAGSILM